MTQLLCLIFFFYCISIIFFRIEVKLSWSIHKLSWQKINHKFHILLKMGGGGGKYFHPSCLKLHITHNSKTTH